jgi:hypothetical protein
MQKRAGGMAQMVEHLPWVQHPPAKNNKQKREGEKWNSRGDSANICLSVTALPSSTDGVRLQQRDYWVSLTCVIARWGQFGRITTPSWTLNH